MFEGCDLAHLVEVLNIKEKLERKVLKYCAGVRKKNVLVQFLLEEKKEGGQEGRTGKKEVTWKMLK